MRVALLAVSVIGAKATLAQGRGGTQAFFQFICDALPGMVASLKPCGVYFGTQGGQVFASADAGERWSLAAEYLPPVYSVTAAVVE